MNSVADFISLYQQYDDEELYTMQNNLSGYSPEAQQALESVIEQKGGLAALEKRLRSKQQINIETNRIKKETSELGRAGIDESFIKTTSNSSLLPEELVHEIISKKYAEIESELADKKITSKTVISSIMGCGIASLVGGVLWSLQLIFAHAYMPFLVIGLAIICYGIIKFITKQSRNNRVVFIFTAVAIVLSLVIAQLLYEIIGYQG